MDLPFSAEQFYAVFRDYNQTFWPAQLVLLVLAAAAIVLVARPRRWSDVIVSGILAFFWAWLGIAYHLAFFTRINPLAYAFAAVSLAGAAVFFWQGVLHHRLHYRWQSNGRSWTGAVLVAFALLAYPAWSHLAGHRYPEMPTFGLPCPTTIFTIGVLAWLVAPYPRSPLVVPVLWCAVGAQAAFLLGVTQDLGLIVAGLVGLLLVVRAKRPAAGSS